jgi:uncharacterized membrane protein
VIHDDEAESASNAYLLSLVLLMVGAPLPFLNLLASVIFYLSSRRSSPFVRWHSMQALLTHLVVVPVNSVFLWMTLAILFGYRDPDNFYVGWFFFMAGLNAVKMSGSIYTAIKVRRGVDVRWWALAPVVDALTGHRRWRECLPTPLAGVLVLALVAGTLTHLPWTGMLTLDVSLIEPVSSGSVSVRSVGKPATCELLEGVGISANSRRRSSSVARLRAARMRNCRTSGWRSRSTRAPRSSAGARGHAGDHHLGGLDDRQRFVAALLRSRPKMNLKSVSPLLPPKVKSLRKNMRQAA